MIFFIIFFFVSDPAAAITLKECQVLALANSRLLESYDNLIQSSIYSYRKDKLAVLPQLSIFYQPDYAWFGDQVDFARQGWRHKLGTTISMDVSKILADYPQLSNLEIEKSTLIRKIAESEVLRDLTQDYYQLYVLLRKKVYYSEAESFISRHTKDIESLHAKGVDLKLDLIRARMQLNSLNISFSNLNREITSALNSLNSMMNTGYKESDFTVMDTPDLAADKAGQVFPEGNASRTNPGGSELSKMDELDLKIAEEKYRQSKYSYLPSLQGGFEYNAHTLDPAVERFRTFIELDLNLFDFGQKSNEEKILKFSYESQKKLSAENQKKLKFRIDQLITEIKNLQIIYQNALDNISNAEKALDTAKEYYQQGKIKETDILSIFSEYLGAQDQSYDTLSDFLSKKAELDTLSKGLE